MELNEALELLLDGYAVLFTGAGFSLGAINLLGQPFKLSSQLTGDLAEECGLPDDIPLDDAADEYIRLKGAEGLISKLNVEFRAKEVTSTHRLIAKVPWRRIYTTNYDNVLEKAYSEMNKSLKPVTLSDEARLRHDKETETLCVHLNGFIETVNKDTINSELKLTNSSYLTTSVKDSPWAAKLRADLELARAVFFIGYSLADIDIGRILVESPELSGKSFFVVGSDPSATIVRRASRFGTVMSIDTDSFADLLAEKAEVYVPQSPDAHIGYSIKQFSIPDTQPQFSDQSIFELLMWGRIESALVWHGLHEGNQYFLERAGAQNILNDLERGSRIAIVHSELGNGKTLLLEGLKCRALERGYQVYVASVRGLDLLRELDQILSTNRKTLPIPG